MNKKIVSYILAFSTLATTANAATLKNFIGGTADLTPSVNITNALNSDGVFEVPAVNTAVTAQIKKSTADSSAYAQSATASAFGETFDLLVTLNMDAVKQSFTTLYSNTTSAINNSTLKNGSAETKDDYIDQFKNSVVSGSFDVSIRYNSKFAFNAGSIVLSQEGHSTPAIFEIDNVGTPTMVDASTNEVIVKFKVSSGVTVETINQDLTKLDNLYVSFPGVAVPTNLNKNESVTASAQLTSGVVDLTDGADKYGKINFASNDASVTLTYIPTYSGSSSSGSSSSRPVVTPGAAPSVKVSVDGTTREAGVYMNSGKYFLNVENISVPGKEGFAFEGWYTDPYFSNHVNGTIQVTEDMTLYPRYINLNAPEQLISEEHIAYISGYPDGTIQPNGNITREEVVSAFYRLLKPEFKATIETSENNFPDVSADRWSNTAISTMANGGFVVGDANGNFNPSAPITRAEFVTIATKFLGNNVSVPDVNQFTDISGHWAEKAILLAANGAYWISGYEDGTFRPDNYITRAEAMTIINKMLVRYGDANATDAANWPDVSTSDWYYSQVIEATTTNEYERLGNGWQEKWVSSEDEAEAPAEGDEEEVIAPETDEITEDETDGTEEVIVDDETADEDAEEITEDETTEDTSDDNSETEE